MKKTIVIALSIVLVGIGIGVDFLAPNWVPLPAWLLSITALIIIFVFNLNLRHKQIREEFNELKDQLQALDREIVETRVELDAAQDKLNNNLENPKIASELRMLRSLMKQFTDKVNGQLHTEDAISEPAVLEQPEIKQTQQDQAITREPILEYSDNEILKFLEKAVREDHIELYLQPIVRLPQRSQVFFECFSRIMDDKSNIIRPEQYLPVAASAGLAAAANIPMSTHLYPEVAAHVMRVTRTAHFLEWQDWAEVILAEPYKVVDGALHIPDRPGLGLDWNEEAVSRYQVV